MVSLAAECCNLIQSYKQMENMKKTLDLTFLKAIDLLIGLQGEAYEFEVKCNSHYRKKNYYSTKQMKPMLIKILLLVNHL